MADGGMFVYVSHEGSNEIFVMQLAPADGQLTLIEKVPTGGIAMPMAVSPDRRFLYVAIRTEPYAVLSFAIDALNGRLTELGRAPLPDTSAYISTDRTGRFLFAASNPYKGARRTNQISVSAIGPHGFIQPPHQVIRTEPKTHAILPDPSNRYLFVSSCDGGVMLRRRFDAATGRFSSDPLTPVRVKELAGPRHFVFHPNNRFMYLLNETDASVYAFSYDINTGELVELQILSGLPPDFKDTPLAADVHLTPDGRFLYTSERNSSTLAAFKVDLASGMLTPAGNFPTEKVPRGFNIDPYGRYLLVAGRASHSMTSYSIDRESGSLNKLKQYPMGKGPNWIEIVRLP